MSNFSRGAQRQYGMVSIMVTMILLVVISLIVLGFAQISRRNQRQSLDRQLSTQAFYAAETGVNDVRDLIKAAVSTGAAVPAKSDCTNGSGPAAAFYAALNPTVNATANVSYSCVMVDPAPPSLQYGDIGMTSTVAPIITSSAISSLTLTWQNKDGSTTPTSGCPSSANAAFSVTSSWTCGYGVLRFDLVPTGGSLTASGLQNNTMTSFLVPVPSSSTTSIPYPAGSPASSANTNNRVATRCTNSGCSMTITGLSGTQYYLRLMSIYKDVALQIVAQDASGNPLGIQGSQALIDATGKAQDVLRRIQVRVPLTQSSTNQLADYAVESTDAICKRFVSMDGYFQSYAGAAVSGLSSITTPPNPLCQ